MRGQAVILCVIMLLCADVVQAFPPIYIYTYSPPVNSLQLVTQKPKENVTYNTPPEVVTLTYSMALDADKSSIIVYDAYNNPIAVGKSMPKDNVMTLSLPAKMYSGTYRVEWKATCLKCNGADTLTNTFYFNVL